MNFSRVDAQKTEDNSDCRVLAPFVMTLFDGEADELESRRARAHLLVCQSCAMRWLDWNRSRDLLQSAPVPAPPPQLLWRVLMACRLATASKRGLARRNDAKNQSAMGLPGDLTAQILARTTRATHQTPTRTPARKSAPAPGFSVHFTPRRVSALAAPALAVWMMVLQRDAWLPLPVSAPASVSRPRLPSPAFSPVSSRRAAIADSVVPRRPVLKPLSVSLNDLTDENGIAPRAAISKTGANSPLKTRLVSSRAATWVTATDVELPSSTISARRALGTSPFSVTASSRFASDVEVMDSSRAPVRLSLTHLSPTRLSPTRLSTRRLSPGRLSPVRLAAFSSQRATPRLRAARWQVASPPTRLSSISAEMETQNSDFSATRQVLRVSLPTVPSAARATLPINAPNNAPARLLAENFESDDDRVDEIRSVVDDFRATLGSDDTAGTETDDEDSAG